jgi:ribonuclease BN (tRNA processing enzyme)
VRKPVACDILRAIFSAIRAGCEPLASSSRPDTGRFLVKIRALGCHGSDQLLDRERHQCRTCGFLINDTVMLDAGTVGAALTLPQQRRIRHVLLSHLHFDHIKGLPTLADNLVEESVRPVVLSSIPQVLDGLQAYIFNGEVYPDFLALPDPHQSIFVCRSLEAGKEYDLSGLQVTAIPVNHTVPTIGFIIRDREAAFVYSGDTHDTDELWRAAAQERTLKAALIEVSFPDEMLDLARVSRHLTPSLFAQQFRKLGRPDLPVHAYHLKPRFRDEIKRQLAALGIPRLTVLEEDQEIIL